MTEVAVFIHNETLYYRYRRKIEGSSIDPTTVKYFHQSEIKFIHQFKISLQ